MGGLATRHLLGFLEGEVALHAQPDGAGERFVVAAQGLAESFGRRKTPGHRLRMQRERIGEQTVRLFPVRLIAFSRSG